LTIRLGVAKTDSLAPARLAALERLDIHSQKFHLRRTEEPMDGKLVAFLRVLQMDQSALQAVMEKEKAEAEQLCDLQVETSVDGKVMQYMITRAALLLRSYPTTLEQDQATIKDTKDPIQAQITQLLLCEKRILVTTVAFCENRLQIKDS